jgi:hypothetical protein
MVQIGLCRFFVACGPRNQHKTLDLEQVELGVLMAWWPPWQKFFFVVACHKNRKMSPATKVDKKFKKRGSAFS